MGKSNDITAALTYLVVQPCCHSCSLATDHASEDSSLPHGKT